MMMKTSCLLVFTLFIGFVSCFSGTVPPTCNAYAEYGCTMFEDKDGLDQTTLGGGTRWRGNNPYRYARNVTYEDELCYIVEPEGEKCPGDDNGDDDITPNCKCRMNCIDENPGIMPWAGRPIHRPDLYQLSVKQGYDFFVPGRTTILQLETLQLGYNFRGLVLYAVAGNADPMSNSTDVMNEQRVGSWDVPADDIYYYVTPSDAPEDCRNIIMHLAAAEKPLLSFFRFTAPVDAPDTITFRVLIKTGNANTGDFYRPNAEDFSLRRGTDADLQSENSAYNAGIKYVRSESGQSCDDACSSESMRCNAGYTNDIESEEAMDAVRADVDCSFPSFALCDTNSPAAQTENPSQCYYRDTDSCSAAETTCSDTFSGDINRRLCACGSSGFRISSTGNFGIFFGILSVLSFVGLSSRKQTIFVIVAFALVFSMVPQASAHNWIFSDSRADGSASVVFPCQPSRTPKPNIQVARTSNGLGQNGEQTFAVEWATGHGAFVYFALVDANDESELRKHSTTVFNNYLNEAIDASASNNIIHADGGRYHKQHRYYHGGCCGPANSSPDLLDPECTNNDRSSRTVTTSTYVTDNVAFDQTNPLIGNGCNRDTWEENFIEKYDNCTTSDRGVYEQLRFTRNAMDTDRNGEMNGDKVVVGYDSAAYPWIKGVWKYEIEMGLSGGRMDVANFWIPEKYPVGRYVIHYFWNGFFDCVDVDNIENSGELTTSPCGERYGDQFDESRVDHCWFPEPDAFFGPVMKIVEGDFNPCMARCLRHREARCQGIMIFPMRPPNFADNDVSRFFLDEYALKSLDPLEWPRYARNANQAFGRINGLTMAEQGQAPYCRTGIRTQGDRLCTYLDLHYELYNLTARDRNYADTLRGDLESAYQSAYDTTSSDMWCAAVVPRGKTNTKDVQLTTDDPRNPAFYSTCVTVSDRVIFPLAGPDGDYPDARLGGEKGPYRFGDKCLDCENRRRNAGPIGDPLWTFTDKCLDCDRVDMGINETEEDTSVVHSTNMQLIVPNYRCTPANSRDSSINTTIDDLTTRNFYPPSATCTPAAPNVNNWLDFQSCSILLGGFTRQGDGQLRGVPGWTPSDATFDRNVCAYLASQDDRCDTDAIWIDQSSRPRNPSFVGGGGGGSGLEAGYFTDFGCRCYIRPELRGCCGDCSSDNTDFKNTDNGADIFSLTVAPALAGGNCTSASQGIYSEQYNVCCHPDCPTCQNSDAWTAGGHMCNARRLSEGLAAYDDDYVCSKVGAPCLVDA